MKFSWTKNRLYTLALVAITGVALSILFLLFDQTVKDSGPAEWLSALLNLVMAGAAVAAFLTARSWLPQLTTQEGYRLAIDLVNKEFIWLGIQNPLLPDTSSLVTAAEQLFLVSGCRSHREAFENAITRLEKTVLDNKKRLDRIDMAMFQMRTYGLQVEDNKSASMNTMLQAFRESVSGASDLLAIVRHYQTVREREMSKPISHSVPGEAESRKEIMKTSDREALDKVNDTLKILAASWNTMVLSQGTFTGDDHRIAKLFVVRRG